LLVLLSHIFDGDAEGPDVINGGVFAAVDTVIYPDFVFV